MQGSLGSGSESPHYPKGMAGSMDELYEWWQELGPTKRLALFVPYESCWQMITDNWEHVVHFPSAAGDGLDDYRIIWNCFEV